MTTKRVKISTRRIFMEMMLESNPHKDWGTFLKNLPNFIEIDAEILPECACSASTVTIHCPVHDADPVAEGECCELGRYGRCSVHGDWGHTPKEAKCECASCKAGHKNGHNQLQHIRALPPTEPIDELDMNMVEDNAVVAELLISQKLNEVIRAVNHIQSK